MTVSWTTVYFGILKRDLLLLYRHPFLWITPPVFFILIMTIFSIAIDASPVLLRTASPGIIWSSALLATLLSHDNIFRPDAENGFVEQMIISSQPLTLIVLAKTTAHWLLTGLPLVIMSPIAAALLYFPTQGLPAMILTLPMATAILSILASFGTAITVGQRNGLLTVLIILPLSIPTLIFSTAIARHAIEGLPIAAAAYLLAAIFVFSFTLLPIATSAVLRLSEGMR